MINQIKYKQLFDVATYGNSRIKSEKISFENYISTENMIADKGGITTATTIPESNTQCRFSKNEILVSNIRPYFKKIWFAKFEGGCSNDVLVLCPKSNINPKFLYYVLSDNNFFNYATVTSKGTKMPRGSKHAIMKYLIPDIDLPTQKRIADILSAYDDLIENNNRRIALLEKAAQDLYKEWFVRFRFPGYEKTTFVNGLPEGWEVVKLQKFLIVKYGKDHKTISEGNIPIYGSGGIMRYGNESLYNEESILIPRKGTLNNITYINEPFWTVDTMFYTQFESKTYIKYLYFVLSKIDMASLNAGSALPSMTTDILYNMKVLKPFSFIAEKFNKKVDTFFENAKILKLQNQNLKKQRDLLLPRLMSGKLEV